MARKAATILILVMVTVGVVSLALLQHVCAAEQTWIVISTADSGWGTLRSCLANATTGDTITFDSSVFPPTSPVNINLNSELPHIIQGNLTIDASGAGVILNGSQTPADTVGLFVDSESNTIKGLQVLHFPGCGIRLTANARACSISGNSITNNNRGILLDYSSNNNTISGNNITNNEGGIWLFDSSNNTISGNNITANKGNGIKFESSSNNSINENKITNNGYGIYLYSSSDNSISENKITANNQTGIHLDSSSTNSISGNNITNNVSSSFMGSGIELGSSNDNIISGNNIANNNYFGISLGSSSNNSMIGNNITTNKNYGIYLYSSSNNFVYHNNFINNTPQVTVSGGFGNVWDDGAGKGNYWSDYEDKYPDAEEIEGIWDTPYVIDENNRDNYPIVPEFPSFLILPLFIIATLLAVIVYRRKRTSEVKQWID